MLEAALLFPHPSKDSRGEPAPTHRFGGKRGLVKTLTAGTQGQGCVFYGPPALICWHQRGVRMISTAWAPSSLWHLSFTLLANKTGRGRVLSSAPCLVTYQGSPAFPEWQCPQPWCHFCSSTSSSPWHRGTAWAGSRRSHRTVGGSGPVGCPQNWPLPGT